MDNLHSITENFFEMRESQMQEINYLHRRLGYSGAFENFQDPATTIEEFTEREQALDAYNIKQIEYYIKKSANRIDEESVIHQCLQLNTNHLGTLPESIGDLVNLKQLDLRNNPLHVLPDCKLPNLKFLDLSNNQLTVLPSSIGDLPEKLQRNLIKHQPNAIPHSMDYLSEWLDK